MIARAAAASAASLAETRALCSARRRPSAGRRAGHDLGEASTRLGGRIRWPGVRPPPGGLRSGSVVRAAHPGYRRARSAADSPRRSGRMPTAWPSGSIAGVRAGPRWCSGCRARSPRRGRATGSPFSEAVSGGSATQGRAETNVQTSPGSTGRRAAQRSASGRGTAAGSRYPRAEERLMRELLGEDHVVVVGEHARQRDLGLHLEHLDPQLGMTVAQGGRGEEPEQPGLERGQADRPVSSASDRATAVSAASNCRSTVSAWDTRISA